MKVSFAGAGPGDPELVTLKTKSRIENADIIVWAGSLVNPAILTWARRGVPTHDSSGMTLDEVCALYLAQKDRRGSILRLHTGDPSLYGAIQEQIDFCSLHGIETEVIPGVSSIFAAAASLQRELTLPGLSQSLVITRAAGRTRLPPGESLESFAAHGSSLALFLSGGLLSEAAESLMAALPPDTPLRLVQRASWPDERKASCRLDELAELAAQGGWENQTMLLAGKVFGEADYQRSKLYDKSFAHGRRGAR